MVWPAVIAAGAAIANGMMSNASAKSREKAADYRQYDLSKKLWEYQMSNSHQFQIEDLKKAGLNPILSASAQSNTTGNVGGHIASGGNFENVLTNAVQGFQAYQQAKVQNSQVGVNEATAQNQVESAKNQKQQAEYQELKNNYLRDHPDAQRAEFGNQNTSHPFEMFKGFGSDLNRHFGSGVRDASKFVKDKYEQFERWFKTDSPIANAKQVDENIKRGWARFQKHRKSHPLYGKNY